MFFKLKIEYTFTKLLLIFYECAESLFSIFDGNVSIYNQLKVFKFHKSDSYSNAFLSLLNFVFPNEVFNEFVCAIDSCENLYTFYIVTEN